MADGSLLRLAHIAGAVLLLGNVIVTGVWAAYLFRRRDAVPFRPVARAILLTDLIFTAGGGALLTISGIMLAMRGGYRVFETPWLLKGIVALGASTLVWLVLLLPDQLRMERRAEDPAPLRRVFIRWSVAGWMSTALLCYGFWVMITRS